ncbi:electron transport complex subunit RsxB, partial [Vibrio fluvialis]|nr:electron transport complex subunit RsxB [Vibrio fluvialis]
TWKWQMNAIPVVDVTHSSSGESDDSQKSAS